ncbi:MAG: hypothetical protein Q4B72_02145 [Lachnospiraceae bacterium]|nr:hypothetical protein [Lachnospiraceae bacterium]
MKESKPMNKSRIILEIVLKSVLFALCAGAVTTFSHILTDIFIIHRNSKPEGLSEWMTYYSIFDRMLTAVAYYVLGRKIPVRNFMLRGLAFAGLNYISNYIPQIMGLAFADGAIAQSAFSTSILISDTIAFTLQGIVLGLVFHKVPEAEKRPCEKGRYAKAIGASALAFPILVFLADQLIRMIYPAFSSSYVMQVSDGARTAFFINFYSWFIVAGAFIAVFYRLTQYNANGSFLAFGLQYGLFLWTPVVMIMVLFGTAFVPTAFFAAIFLLILLVLSWMNERILTA